jgi:hypothetical protein
MLVKNHSSFNLKINTMTIKQLPTVNIDGMTYYIDERLMELRNTLNLHDVIELSELDLYEILENLNEGGEDVLTEDIG